MELKNTDEKLTRGRQDLHMVRLSDAGDNRTFRTTVKRDSYDFQSFARVEIWTAGQGWQEVVTLRGDHPVMAELPSYAVPEAKREGAYAAMRAVARMLETQAEEVTR